MKTLDEKIHEAIINIQNGYGIAEKMGITVNCAFSGGKDSQVLKWLCDEAKIQYSANFQCTTVDPPQLLKFIKNKYPDVIWHKPKLSMFQLIEKKGFLPIRHIRYCCDILKENTMPNTVTLIGVRKSESVKRSKYETTTINCVRGNDKIIIRPILEFTEQEIWQIIKTKIGFWCELYDLGLKRIGCIGCPMTSKNNKKRELLLAPRFEYAYKKAIKKVMINGKYIQFENENDVWNWYISGLSMKKYFLDKQQTELF